MVALLQQLQHHAAAIAEAASAAAECAAARDALSAARLAHLRAGCHAALREAAAALNAYKEADAAHARLSLEGEEAWRLKLDVAAARGRLGLALDDAEAAGGALEAARRRVHELGLAEMLVRDRAPRICVPRYLNAESRLHVMRRGSGAALQPCQPCMRLQLVLDAVAASPKRTPVCRTLRTLCRNTPRLSALPCVEPQTT